MNVVKHIGPIVGMILIAFLILVLVTYVEDPLLDSIVSTGPDISVDVWRELFRYWSAIGIGAALVAAIVWYLLGQWGFNMDDWASAGKRSVWLLMLILPLGAFVASWLRTPLVQEGVIVATIFYLANNLAVYYLATLCCSPSSFKYTPLGAVTLRRW